MEEQMDDASGMNQNHIALLVQCSRMDSTLVERLRDTVTTSLNWAEETLDTLIGLEDDLEALKTLLGPLMLQIEFQSQTKHPNAVSAGLHLSGPQPAVSSSEEGLQRLRDRVRDLMMSMQQQDVVGQAMERAASALERRAAAIREAKMDLTNGLSLPDEILDIHEAYRAEDDRHRVPVSQTVKVEVAVEIEVEIDTTSARERGLAA